MDEPKVGEPYRIGAETLIPSYVAAGHYNNQEGWYIEFRYPDSTEQYRRFIYAE